jgi:hypothetical protein
VLSHLHETTIVLLHIIFEMAIYPLTIANIRCMIDEKSAGKEKLKGIFS